MIGKSLPLLLAILTMVLSAASAPSGAEDARYQSIAIRCTLDDDGSWLTDYRHTVRLASYNAINRLGETFIVTNPAWQELKVLKAETTMANGRKVPSPANAFNEVLPGMAAGFADFAGLREMVITHTGLERGAVVELHYQIRTRAGAFPFFTLREPLGRPYPVDEFRLLVDAPASLPLTFQTVNVALEPTITPAGNRLVREWRLRDLAAMPGENGSSPADQPFLLVAAAPDGQPAFPRLPSPGEVPADLRSEDRAEGDLRLPALVRRMAETLALCPVPLSLTGLTPRPLARVFASGYATRLEKALALRALLAQRGFPSRLLAVADSPAYTGHVPAWNAYDTFLLQAGGDGTSCFIDPTTGAVTARWRPRGDCLVLDLDSGKTERLPPASAAENTVAITGRVVLGTDKTSAALTLEVSGHYHQPEAVADDPKRFAVTWLGKVFPDTEWTVRRVVFLDETRCVIELDGTGNWLAACGKDSRVLPPFHLPVVQGEWAQTNRRETSFRCEVPFVVSLDLTMVPPAGYAFENLPAAFTKKNEIGASHLRFSPLAEGSLQLSSRCELDRNLIPASAWADFTSLIRPLLGGDQRLYLARP